MNSISIEFVFHTTNNAMRAEQRVKSKNLFPRGTLHDCNQRKGKVLGKNYCAVFVIDIPFTALIAVLIFIKYIFLILGLIDRI